MMHSTGQMRRTWTAPVIIAAVTLGSLIGALLTEEADRDAIAALILFLAFAYAIGLGLSRRKRSPKRSA
jgi:uncharacterized membrane protein YfcA